MAKLSVEGLNQTHSASLNIDDTTAEDLVFELINGGWASASGYDPSLGDFRSIVSTQVFVDIEEGRAVLEKLLSMDSGFTKILHGSDQVNVEIGM